MLVVVAVAHIALVLALVQAALAVVGQEVIEELLLLLVLQIQVAVVVVRLMETQVHMFHLGIAHLVDQVS
jgi:hypothetical protein